MRDDDAGSSQTDMGRGRLLILSAACLWSLAGVFIKFLDVPPLTIVFYRSFFACLVFAPFVRRTQWRFDNPVLVSVLAYSAAISAFVSANKLTSAANAIVLQYTAPIFVFVFSRLALGDAISRVNAVTLVAGMAGVLVISLDSSGRPEMTGVALALLSGALFAAYMINLRRTAEVEPIYLTWVNNGFCSLAIFPLVSSDLALTTPQLAMVAVMGVVQLGLPYFLFSKGLERVPLQEAALLALVEPVLNPMWVALLVGEIPSSATLAGSVMIVAGLALRYLWPLVQTAAASSDE